LVSWNTSTKSTGQEYKTLNKNSPLLIEGFVFFTIFTGMKKILIFLFLTTLFTSCASFENLTDDRHRPEDDEMYWNGTEEFWVTHHKPNARPESSEDYYGNRRVIIPPIMTNDYSPTYYRPYYGNYPVYHNTPQPTYNPPRPQQQGPVNKPTNNRSGGTQNGGTTHIKRP
jgi:hypothetical protein